MVALRGRPTEVIRDEVRKRYEHLFGPPSRTARFKTKEDRVIEILKWDAAIHPDGVNFYATLGSSEWEMPAGHGHRVEFFVGLLPAADDVADSLAEVALHPASGDKSLDYGHTITLAEPLWKGSSMRTFLVGSKGRMLIEPLELKHGQHVEFMQLIPLFPREAEYLREKGGEEALMRQFEKASVPYWDPQRREAAL